jgi:hypothetical protein
MNPLRFRPLAQQVVRQQRTKATMANKAFPPRSQSNFKQEWLSDPSTYPIFAVMGGGLIFMVAMMGNALFTYKQGVDISPNQRGRIMKQYSSDYRIGVVERFTEAKGGVKSEGLGIDHEKWTKEKEEYMKK